MAGKAQSLADRFTQANDEFVVVVEPLSREQWLTLCPGEKRTVAAVTRHVAEAHAHLIAAFMAIANGQSVPTTSNAALDAANAENGERYAACDQAETVQLLKGNGADAAARLRSLTDEQLARTGVFNADAPAMTTERLIERVLIWHPQSHLASIRDALGQTASRDTQRRRL